MRAFRQHIPWPPAISIAEKRYADLTDSLVVSRRARMRFSHPAVPPATMVAVKPTIFVVEDDPDISRLVRHHLEGAGFNARLYATAKRIEFLGWS